MSGLDVPLVVSVSFTLATIGLVFASQLLRGARRLIVQRLGVFGAVPASTACLVLLPMYFDVSISDGLAIAGLVLSLILAAGAGLMSRLGMRLRIGIVIPSRVPFHSELRAGLAEALQGVRLHTYDDYLVTNRAMENLADFVPALRRTLRWRPDYLVVCSPSPTLVSGAQVADLLIDHSRRGGGVIFIDNPSEEPVLARMGKRYGSVTSDFNTGARILAEFVGSQLDPDDEVLILAGPTSATPAIVRREVFEQQFPNAHIQVADTGGWTDESTYRIALKRLNRGQRPRFIVCGNDVMALGAVRAIRDATRTQKWWRSPIETEVVGYDGIAKALFAIAETTNPLCATIRTPPSAYGHEIAAMIYAEVESVLPVNRLRQVRIPIGEGQLITRNNVDLVMDS
jgi:ABC-type sugar transport system substrate-binding protein